MKKVLGLFLIITFSLMLVGCNDPEDTDDPTDTVDCAITPDHEDCQDDTDPVDCNLEPDHEDCDEPEVDCAITPNDPECTEEEPTVIRIGTHYAPNLDPDWVDPLTGEGYMAEDQRLASLLALDIVLEDLNVEIEFVEYTGDIREQFLQSVIAQDPVAEVVLMWGGSQNVILSQNVLQDLNPYVEDGVFEGHEWSLANSFFGKYKFMNFHLGSDGTGFMEWPLIYNVTYIDQCPGAKAIGNPSTLWAEGNWTWDVMESMLEALYVCYDGVPGPERPDMTIQPYSTDIRYSLLGFLASNGEYAVRPDGTLGYGSAAGVEASELFLDWYDRGLLNSSWWNDLSTEPGWLWDSYNFGGGETVFTTAAPWLIGAEGADLAGRGEKMGIVPYPVGPSATETGATQYRNPHSPTNQWGVLKGVDSETATIAIEATIMFYEEYYKALGNVAEVDEYWDTLYEDTAHRMFDTLDPDHGQDIMQSMKDIMETAKRGTDMAVTYGAYYDYTSLLGEIMKGYKTDLSTEYAKIQGSLETKVDSLGSIIESDQIRDTIGPSMEVVEDVALAFPIGTDLSADNFEYDGNDWEHYILVTDNMSIIDYDTLEFEFAKNVYGDPEDPDKVTDQITEDVDFNTAGRYVMTVTAVDDNGNEGDQDFTVVIYDDSNSTPPTFTVNDNIFFEPVGSDLSENTWTAYVEEARDTDGIPVMSNIEADLSSVNTTAPGEYDVILTVTDYAGNTATQTVTFRIYDDQETERPVLELKPDTTLEFEVNTNIIGIDWSQYFTATDTLGGVNTYDISNRVTISDYGDLDNSTVGSYTITIRVTDYAGNEATLEVAVDIVAAS